MKYIGVAMGYTIQDITDTELHPVCKPLGAEVTCLLKMLLSCQDVVQGIENII